MKLVINIVFLLSFFHVAIFAQSDADSLRNRNFAVHGYPYLFYTPETQLAVGVGGIATFYLGDEIILRPSKIIVSGYYTSNKQYSLDFNPQFYFMGNKYFFSMSLGYSYEIDRFYGIGDDAPEIDAPEYSNDIFSVSVNFQLPSLFGLSYKSGVIFDYKRFEIVDVMDNPYLLSPAFATGGKTVGLGLTWVWDSRDNIFYSTKGSYYQIKARFFSKTFGGDFDFNIYSVDLRKFYDFGNIGVVGVMFYGRFARGNPPFYELSALGGQYRMRGYYEGRYRDKNFMTAQIELRKQIWKKLGAVFFFGAGDVSSELQIKNALISEMKYSYGFGLRYLFNATEKVNLRADFGFGKKTSGVYFGIEEVF